MDIVRNFVELNRQIILFVYGLAFFMLGLAIAFQSRHYSRLDLARSLSWLAAFGLTHGLYVWGELFSPTQEVYLSQTGIEILHTLHLIFLGISFACLFEFGVSLLRPLGRGQGLHRVSAGLLIVWTIVSFMVVPRLTPDVLDWHETVESLARYFLGFPGALLAAYGLRQQTFRRIAPLNVPHIVGMLRIAGVALVLYAFFGGLIPSPVPFFPGNILNTATFEQAVGVPPSVFQSLIGLMLAVTFIRALEVFDVETARMIESMELQQIVAAERDRIARDLHDGVIQKVYTAGLLVDSARKQAVLIDSTGERLGTAVTVLNDVIGDLRRNISELHTPSPDESLPIALRQLAEDPRFQSWVDISLDLDLPDVGGFSPTRVTHVLAIVTEALSNIVRHSRAQKVTIEAKRTDNRLHLRIQDDGVGIPANVEAGYGLRNMHDRARLLDGQLSVTGANGKGTTVELDVPWIGG